MKTNYLKDITAHLKNENGVWVPEKHSTISYPEDGNSNFFEIEENSFWFKHRNECLKGIVKNFPPNGLILDVGGGNGFVAKGLNEIGHETFLMEPGREGIANAARRGVKNLIWSTFGDANFKNEIIPAIGLFDVVEHIEDDLGFLRQVYNSLAPDGKLYLTVPAYQFLWSNEDVDAGHFRRYTTQSITSVLKDAGFDIKYASYMFQPLTLPIFFFRSLPSKLGMNKNSDSVEKVQSEHDSKGGLIGGIIDKLLNRELSKIKNGKTIGSGSSCLIVAEKSSL